MEPGQRLPSVRDLVSRYRTSPVTVQRAFQTLTREGLITSRVGQGTFVARRQAAPAGRDISWQWLALHHQAPMNDLWLDYLTPAPAQLVPLGIGYPDQTLWAQTALNAAVARAARRPGVFGHVPVAGLSPLRAWFAREVGGSVRESDVTIVSGGQAALSVAFRALAAPGAPVLVESPTYMGMLAALRAAGLAPIPVPSDRDGVDPDLVARLFQDTGARVLYLQPFCTNPSGATLAAERRQALVRVAERAGAFLVEDDFARDLAIDGEPPRPLLAEDDSRVVYVRSLTKVAAPGLRVAALIARGPAGTRVRAARAVEDMFVSGLLQEVAVDVVTSPAWARHKQRLRAALHARREAACAALARHLPEFTLTLVPRGGLHLWIELPADLDDLAFVQTAAVCGVSIAPGRYMFPAEPAGRFIRLCYAAANPAAIAEGVQRLAEAQARCRAALRAARA